MRAEEIEWDRKVATQGGLSLVTSGPCWAVIGADAPPSHHIGTEEERGAKESDIHRLQICQNDERRNVTCCIIWILIHLEFLLNFHKFKHLTELRSNSDFIF